MACNHPPEALCTPPAWISIDAEIRAWRQLLRGRAAVVRWRTRAKHRMHAALAAENLRVAAPDLCGRAGREWLERAPVSPGTRREITVQLALIAALEEPLRGSDAEVTRLARHPDAQRVPSVPGIGVLGAAFLVGEIGASSRFPTAPALTASAGLVPRTHSAGDQTAHGGGGRESNPWLTWILIEAVPTLKQVPGPVRFHSERRLRAKGTPTATGAAARKVCRYLYWMWRQDLTYPAWLEHEAKRGGHDPHAGVVRVVWRNRRLPEGAPAFAYSRVWRGTERRLKLVFGRSERGNLTVR